MLNLYPVLLTMTGLMISVIRLSPIFYSLNPLSSILHYPIHFNTISHFLTSPFSLFELKNAISFHRSSASAISTFGSRWSNILLSVVGTWWGSHSSSLLSIYVSVIRYKFIMNVLFLALLLTLIVKNLMPYIVRSMCIHPCLRAISGGRKIYH